MVLAIPTLAQTPRLLLGAIGGVPLTEGMPAQDESRRYTVGPAIEAGFGEHFAVEFNALYKRLGYKTPLSESLLYSSYLLGIPVDLLMSTTRFHSWEFPILGKYYFGSRASRDRFFVQTGYAFQRSWTTNPYGGSVIPAVRFYVGDWTAGITDEADRFSRTDSTLITRNLGSSGTTVGAVLGGGLTRKAGPVTVTPSFRYTRWGVRYDGANRNQAEFLLGLWF